VQYREGAEKAPTIVGAAYSCLWRESSGGVPLALVEQAQTSAACGQNNGTAQRRIINKRHMSLRFDQDHGQPGLGSEGPQRGRAWGEPGQAQCQPAWIAVKDNFYSNMAHGLFFLWDEQGEGHIVLGDELEEFRSGDVSWQQWKRHFQCLEEEQGGAALALALEKLAERPQTSVAISKMLPAAAREGGDDSDVLGAIGMAHKVFTALDGGPTCTLSVHQTGPLCRHIDTLPLCLRQLEEVSLAEWKQAWLKKMSSDGLAAAFTVLEQLEAAMELDGTHSWQKECAATVVCEAFQEAGVEPSGHLTERQLRGMLRKLAQGTPWLAKYHKHIAKEARRTFRAFDTERDGGLSFQEVVALLQMQPWSGLLPSYRRARPTPKAGVEEQHCLLHAGLEVLSCLDTGSCYVYDSSTLSMQWVGHIETVDLPAPPPVWYEAEGQLSQLTYEAMGQLMGATLCNRLVFRHEAFLKTLPAWHCPGNALNAVDAPDAMRVLCERGFVESRLVVRRVALGPHDTADHDHAPLGVFVGQHMLHSGVCIADYTGIITDDYSRYAEDDYCTTYPSSSASTFLSAKVMGGVSRLINHSFIPNARLHNVILDAIVHVVVIALRDIMPHEQVSIDYGREYWDACGIEPVALE